MYLRFFTLFCSFHSNIFAFTFSFILFCPFICFFPLKMCLYEKHSLFTFCGKIAYFKKTTNLFFCFPFKSVISLEFS